MRFRWLFGEEWTGRRDLFAICLPFSQWVWLVWIQNFSGWMVSHFIWLWSYCFCWIQRFEFWLIWNSKFPPDNLSNLDAYLIAGDEVTKFNHVSENKRTNQVIKKTKCIGVQAKPSDSSVQTHLQALTTLIMTPDTVACNESHFCEIRSGTE